MNREDIAALAGRLLLAVIFLASAFGKITNFEGTLRYMEANGVPAAQVLIVLAIAVEALGGVALVLGYQVRWAAAALAGFTLIAGLVFHAAPDQRVHLLKNLAIVGGLLQIVAWGPGELSLEGRGRS
jgi:putative oxidoreductase